MKLPMPPTIRLDIKVTPKQEARLAAGARAIGLKSSQYAQLLFDAAYTARVGQELEHPIADWALDEMVRAVLCLAGEFVPEAIAKTLGVSDEFVANALRAWKQIGNLTTRKPRRQATEARAQSPS